MFYFPIILTNKIMWWNIKNKKINKKKTGKVQLKIILWFIIIYADFLANPLNSLV